MGVLPKIAFLLFAASSTGQSDAHISWKSSLKNLPLYEVGHPHSWQGPSSIINVWKDLDDVWPGIFHDHFGRGLMITNPTTFPQRCVQTKHDQDDNTENEFAMEERQLELRQDELQRDLEDLTRRREDHKVRQSLDRCKEERRHLEEQHWRREQIRQQEADAREERQRLEEQRRMERERQRQELLEERRRLQQIAEKEQWLRQQQEAKEREKKLQEQKTIEERQRRQQAEEREWRLRQQEAAERERIKEQQLYEERQRRQQAEREKRINEQERRKFEERESAKLQRKSSTTQRQSPHHQSTKPESQIASLDIPEGYFPEDIALETVGRHIYVKGRHVCSCEENCFEREFERRVSLPNNVDTQSLSGSLYPSGTLTIHGVKYQRTVNPVDTTVPVVGVGMKQRYSSSCNKSKIKKSGFKLKKMNARTGEVMEDFEPIQEHYSYPLYESEVDEDGLTIEVVT